LRNDKTEEFDRLSYIKALLEPFAHTYTECKIFVEQSALIVQNNETFEIQIN
jgi:hypothetical protein